jgi:hypothetical protein
MRFLRLFLTNGPSSNTSVELDELGSASCMNLENPLGVSYLFITRGRTFYFPAEEDVSRLAFDEFNKASKLD